MKKIGISLLLIFIFGCKQKKTKEQVTQESFFPVLSYIKSQVAHVDTSFYSISKVTWLDSVHTDTSYFKREEFGALAKDFLEMPDISNEKYKDLYTEEKFYDEGMNKAILTYKPKDPANAIIQRQEVLISADPGNNKVNSFIIDLITTNKDSSVEKKLLWQVDKSFHVFSTVQKSGKTETSQRIKVIWNENDEE